MSMSMPALVETYFDPDDDLEHRVAEEIRGARHSVWIQAYKFGSEAIVDTILQLKRETPELDVRLALDAREAFSSRDKKQGRLLERIAAAGGQVGYVADADKAHSKFIVIDSKVVLTGSFNFKQHADRVQRDNVVVIRSREVAQTYVSKFQDTATSVPTAAGAGRPPKSVSWTASRAGAAWPCPVSPPDRRGGARRGARGHSRPGDKIVRDWLRTLAWIALRRCERTRRASGRAAATASRP